MKEGDIVLTPIPQADGSTRTVMEVQNYVSLDVSIIPFSIDTWIRRLQLSESLSHKVAESAVVILPTEVPGKSGIIFAFPQGTTDLFDFLKKSNEDTVSVEVCVEDSDYKELGQHADWISIATLVVKSIIAPLVVSLIAEYIKPRLFSRSSNKTVTSELIVTKDEMGSCVRISYHGPADRYETEMNRMLQSAALDAPKGAPKGRLKSGVRRKKK